MHQRKRAVYRVGTATVGGLLPRIVCWTRSGSKDWRRRWHDTARQLGLHYTALAEEGRTNDGTAWITVYDVTGTPLALEELTQPGKHRVVQRWEYFVRYMGPRPSESGGIPVQQGTGMGSAKRPCPVPDGITLRELEKARSRPLPNGV